MTKDFVKLKELSDEEDIRYTNDIKLAATLICRKIELAAYQERQNPRNKRPEIWFGFEKNNELRNTEIMFLSGNCLVDSSSVQDIRDKLLSFVSNRNRELLDSLIK